MRWSKIGRCAVSVVHDSSSVAVFRLVLDEYIALKGFCEAITRWREVENELANLGEIACVWLAVRNLGDRDAASCKKAGYWDTALRKRLVGGQGALPPRSAALASR